MLDIHYSDTWADPQHQETPIAWQDLDAAGMEKHVEDYSKDVITQLKAAGAMPDLVQVGNEITGGMLWPLGHVRVPPSDVKAGAGPVQFPLPDPYDDVKQWDNLIRFIKAGIRGVREGAGDSPVKIVMHIDCGGDWQVTQSWFDHLTAANVDYDIIGQSFYPNYHGTLAMLQHNIVECHNRYPSKPFFVAETGYPQSGGTRIMSPATPATLPAGTAATARSKGYMQWPGTPQGQLQFMADLVNTVKRAGGSGVFYWAPEGFGRGNGMWNADGTPAPSIFVLDNLTALTTQPASRLPDPPTP
jgi:arabinogalactan endo-1,4-beta-galactosidase